MWAAERILKVLDDCCNAYTFPMLDNGYVYLAATRLSLHRSEHDWAMAIEVFGFSPRAGSPDVSVYTFGSRLHGRSRPSDFTTPDAYERYLTQNPHNEMRGFWPLDDGSWQDEEDLGLVAEGAKSVLLRGAPISIPGRSAFAELGIELEDDERLHTFELCRLLAATHRANVLGTATERRTSVPADLVEVLVLDEWNHPDVKDDDERPSNSDTFRQLVDVLLTGDARAYRPSEPPNTHWTNWLDGGTL
jgi:hypothetical protein